MKCEEFNTAMIKYNQRHVLMPTYDRISAFLVKHTGCLQCLLFSILEEYNDCYSLLNYDKHTYKSDKLDVAE